MDRLGIQFVHLNLCASKLKLEVLRMVVYDDQN